MVKRHDVPDVRRKMAIMAGQAHKREDSAPTGAGSPGAALRQHPARLLTTSWPWRSLGYLVTTPTWSSPVCLSVTSNGGACDGSTVVRRRIHTRQ